MSDPVGLSGAPVDIDGDYVWAHFERFVGADTAVLPDQTAVDPHDPRVSRFARELAAPAFERLGATVEVDDLNNVVARFGPLRGSEIALVSYPVTHHANQMHDPLLARQAEAGTGEITWFGLGAGQGKAALAAVCGAAHALLDRGDDLDGRVVLAMSSEGSSSHRSAKSLYQRLNPLPAAAVLAIGTENQLVLGNRGRVDIRIDIPGRPTHSSAPHRGANPILLLSEVLARIGSLALVSTAHPQLGSRAVVPYSLVCGPIAPHTIPAGCRITLDRRMLPGDSPEEAVEDVARLMHGLPVVVSIGPLMLPALTDADNPSVAAMRLAAEAALGHGLPPTFPAWTFDAGYSVSLEIPTLMFGPSSSEISGEGVLEDDHVGEAAVLQAAAVYAAFMSCRLEPRP